MDRKRRMRALDTTMKTLERLGKWDGTETHLKKMRRFLQSEVVTEFLATAARRPKTK